MTSNEKKTTTTTVENNSNSSKEDQKTTTTTTENILNINIGILGHVDSGKTSLVKTLSTLLSTAALDKSKQSRQRGMTLDLGFSCFFIDDVPQHLKEQFPNVTKLQMTLVDCPGHASLIRTIIGGSQIIDMVLLVVDAFKGWQAQTTECLVLAELTSPYIVVALNKIDMFPENERLQRIEQTKNDVMKRLKQTNRFISAKMVGVSACVGGEKVAAITDGDDGDNNKDKGNSNKNSNNKNKKKKDTTADNKNKKSNATSSSSSITSSSSTNETYGMNELIETLKNELPYPKRKNINGPFYFAIDHCFPIRGQGTVLTGTVLNGSISVNNIIEFPTLGRQERKVKSIQMFKRKVTTINQGDRAGICISNFDSKLIERGIASTPNSIQLLKGVIALVKKVPYFPNILKNGSKFHISVGHTTIMATVTFWGAKELYLYDKKSKQQKHQSNANTDNNNNNSKIMAIEDKGGTKNVTTKGKSSKENNDDQLIHGHSSLGGDADLAGLPKLSFDFNQDFIQQDNLLEVLPDDDDDMIVDSSCNDSSINSGTRQEPLLHWALLDFQTPVYCPLDSLIIGSRLDTDTTDHNYNNKNKSSSSKKQQQQEDLMQLAKSLDTDTKASSCRLAFSGRLVEKIDPENDNSRIRLYTPKERKGIIRRLGDPYKRDDDGKTVRYEIFGSDLFKAETNMKLFVGMKLITERNGDIGIIKSSFGTTGKYRVYFPGGTDAREGEALLLKFRRYVHDSKKEMHQDHISIPPTRSGTRIDVSNKKVNKKEQKASAAMSLSSSKPSSSVSSSPSSSAATVVVNNKTNINNNKSKNNNKKPAVVATSVGISSTTATTVKKIATKSTTAPAPVTTNAWGMKKTGAIASAASTTTVATTTTAKPSTTTKQQQQQQQVTTAKTEKKKLTSSPTTQPSTTTTNKKQNGSTKQKVLPLSSSTTSISSEQISTTTTKPAAPNNNNTKVTTTTSNGAKSTSTSTTTPAEIPIDQLGTTNKIGQITLLKGDVLDDGKHNMVIVDGFFSPEVNIRERKGTKVKVTSTDEIGYISGPFGKAGKCKVTFDNGVSANVNDQVELLLDD